MLNFCFSANVVAIVKPGAWQGGLLSLAGMGVWRPRCKYVRVLLGEVNEQTPTTSLTVVFKNLLGITNISRLYFRANKDNFPLEKAGRMPDNACKANVKHAGHLCHYPKCTHSVCMISAIWS